MTASPSGLGWVRGLRRPASLWSLLGLQRAQNRPSLSACLSVLSPEAEAKEAPENTRQAQVTVTDLSAPEEDESGGGRGADWTVLSNSSLVASVSQSKVMASPTSPWEGNVHTHA